MKILISYEYDAKLSYPFVAFAKVGDRINSGTSKDSFEEAESELIAKLTKQFSTPIPEPKEVEIKVPAQLPELTEAVYELQPE